MNALESRDSDSFKEFAFLFGNGLFLSHPLPEVQNAYKIENSLYLDILSEINELLKQITTLNKNICSEQFLNFFRILYGLKIFKIFIHKQISVAGIVDPPTEFLEQFRSIYTINYDINTYRIIFPQNPSNTCRFKDGFVIPHGSKQFELSFSDISNYLITPSIDKIPFHYLHGAFFLFYNQKANTYFKETSGEKKLSNILSDKYQNLIDDFLFYIKIKHSNTDENPPQLSMDDPVVVFSGKKIYKDAFISKDNYLNFCIEKLASEQKIFTFGCSFIIDQHIIDKILEGSKKEIYFGIYDEEHSKSISEYINSYIDIDQRQHKISFIDLKTHESEIQKIIWKTYFDKNPTLEDIISIFKTHDSLLKNN